MGTTWRRDLRAALLSIVTEFRVSNPDLLRGTSAIRPESIAELPFAWVGEIRESITHTSGTRERASTAEVVIVDRLGENSATEDRLDLLADLLLDRFTAEVRRIGTSIIEPVSIDPSEIEVGDGVYRALTFGFGRTSIREGRS